MGVYEQSIQRPFTNLKKLLIGFLFNIIPIVNFIAFGYILKGAKLSMKNNFEMPSWEKKGELFINGFYAFLIQLIYLSPIILLSVILFFSVLKTFIKSIFITRQDLLIDLVKNLVTENLGLFILILMLSIIIIYITPLAVLNFISKNSFKHGFDFPVIFKKAFTGKYFIAFLVVLLYTFLIYFLLGFIPFLGSIIASFIVQLTSYSVYGAIFNKI